MTAIRITGGCQCGAVRYALHAQPTNPHLCHCRMCQKAFGSYFAPLAGVRRADFELTRGALSIFRSSEEIERGFCSACGTPLSFSWRGGDRISVSLGSLDDPAAIRPALQMGVESRMPWFEALAGLPEKDTGWRPEQLDRIRATSRQHPDHDTGSWPPAA